MVEDLVMEFDESAPDVGPGLARSWSVQRELEDALVPMMTGLVQIAGWMDEGAQPAMTAIVSRALAVVDPLPRHAGSDLHDPKDAFASSCGYANPRLI